MDQWTADIQFERQGALRRAMKATIINPLANYLPASLLKSLLGFGKSELAAANWVEPGGWRSMVISYHGKPTQIADKVLVGMGTMSMALRNRKRLGARLLARLIEQSHREPAHVLCLGAGPGQITVDAMSQAKRDSVATLVDLNSEPFDFGRELAAKHGLSEKVRFIQADLRHGIDHLLDQPPDLVKMIGICEYLGDELIVEIAGVAAKVMPGGAPIVFNSLSRAHGNDRFFRRVFGLNMIYRTPEHLQSLMQRAGFEQFHAIREPLGVYHVIVGRRVGQEPAAKGS